LIETMPEHRTALLEMAQAWQAIADEAEHGRNGSTRPGDDEESF
jgi:hypothetical protein